MLPFFADDLLVEIVRYILGGSEHNSDSGGDFLKEQKHTNKVFLSITEQKFIQLN